MDVGIACFWFFVKGGIPLRGMPIKNASRSCHLLVEGAVPEF
jgi:hypothetical protein